MLIILFSLVSLCFTFNWMVIMLNLLLMVMISVANLNLNFVYSENLFFLLENMSSLLIFLAVILCLLAILCTPMNKEVVYTLSIIILLLFLVISFSSNNLMSFYIFFEASLIPTLILIICWGYQPERLQAGTYMMLYTVMASLPLLLFLLWVNMEKFTLSVSLLIMLNMNINILTMVIVTMMAFLVKLPIYMFHLWLPKAHVEAPLAGSMILAGILLKLGGYGLYLFQKSFSFKVLTEMIFFISSVSLWGGFIASILCLRQTDIKSLVAYSSVSHMSLVITGNLFNSAWGISSMKITMLSHGFMSSGLFLMAYITYIKSMSRNLFYSGGMLSCFPILTMMWFIFLCFNMAAPPSLNLIGEMLIIPALWMGGWIYIVVMLLLMMFSVIFNMFLYSMVNHGQSNKLVNMSSTLVSGDYLGLMLHLMPMMIIFKMSFFMV